MGLIFINANLNQFGTGGQWDSIGSVQRRIRSTCIRKSELAYSTSKDGFEEAKTVQCILFRCLALCIQSMQSGFEVEVL